MWALDDVGVAPFVGAWIEIAIGGKASYSLEVAPFVGAWIEICLGGNLASGYDVAPFVGAWIEILHNLDSDYLLNRRSVRRSVD